MFGAVGKMSGVGKCSVYLEGLQAAPEKAGTHDHDTTTSGEQESSTGGEQAGKQKKRQVKRNFTHPVKKSTFAISI